jgi:hypothetical protein
MRKLSRALTIAWIPLLAGCLFGGKKNAPQPAAAAAAPAPAVRTPYPPPERVYYDNGGGIQDSLSIVIRDDATLKPLWTRATSAQPSPPASPTADFSREMFVLVSAGRKALEDEIHITGATVTPKLNSAGATEDVLDITVELRQGCRRVQSDGYPVEIVRMRRFTGPIHFVEQTVPAQNCGEAPWPMRD